MNLTPEAEQFVQSMKTDVAKAVITSLLVDGRIRVNEKGNLVAVVDDIQKK
jgi:hypothetical protein